MKIYNVLAGTLLFIIILMNASANPYIGLKDNKGELKINNSASLNNVSSAEWNIFVKQNNYTPNAGLFGKYKDMLNRRSYVIRTANTNEISIALSGDGTNKITYGSNLSRNCGIRNNNEWTMITVAFNGSYSSSYGLIQYLRNGVWCDSDLTPIKRLYNVPLPLRIGGGNDIFLNGSVDDSFMFKTILSQHQLYRFYQESNRGLKGIKTIPVLLYHQITTPADVKEKVSNNNFRQQMAYLKNNGFTTITTIDYDKWKKGTFTMPKRPVLIYFDDGRDNIYTNVTPIFDQYGYKANIAVVTRYVDKATSGGWKGYMNWSQLKTLQNKGWEISSHGVDHVDMLTLDEEEFREELNLSRYIIRTRLGKIPISFIFPFNSANVIYTSICGQYYSLCWTVGTRDTMAQYIDYTSNGSTYQSLRRISISNTTTMQNFKNLFAREITKPVGLWPIDEGKGKITHDRSGYGNNAYLNDYAIWKDE